LGVFLLAALAIGPARAQDGTRQFRLESKSNHHAYEVEVTLPNGAKPPDSGYPTVYCMDSFVLGDYIKSLPRLMAMGRVAEPYVLVGIADGTNMQDWAIMRTRDFTPAKPVDDYSKSFMVSAAIDQTGGAPSFVAFLKSELIPYVESNYPCDPARRCFLGYSLGGLLGTHILATDPQLFQYYLLGSASLWFNEYYLEGELAKLAPDGLRALKGVYVSVGDEESWEMMRSYAILRTAARRKGVDPLRIKSEIIPSAGHVGAMPISLYNGLRFLLPGK